MDFKDQLSFSYYKIIASLNEQHHIYLVQHQESKKIFVRKDLDVYSLEIYRYLYENPIPGTPRIIFLYENNNTLSIIEEYIQGSTLRGLIDSQSLSSDQICIYLMELCDILNRLHTNNPPIIHRDIKPSNIIISDYGRIVLLDFNASRYYSGDENKESDTTLLGTHGYAAPEQYGFGESTPKTDIYSIGILLKELSSSLEDAPKEFNTIISNCTKILAKDRYSSVMSLKYDLAMICKDRNDTSLEADPSRSPIPPGYRTRTPWKMIVATLFYLTIIALCSSTNFQDSYGISLYIKRFFSLILFLGNIFAVFNYMDIQRFFPLCKSKNILLKILGYVLLIFTVSSATVMLMLFLLSFFEPK